MIEIPVEILNFLNTILTAALLVVVVEGLKDLSDMLGRDLTGYATAITAAVVGAILTAFKWLVTLIPAQYVPAVNAVFAFLVMILGAYGIHRLIKQRGIR